MTLVVFGYLIFSIAFYNFIVPFSPDLSSCRCDCEDISKAQEIVCPNLQTPQSLSEMLYYVLYFQLSSQGLEMTVKHGLSCLMH